MARRLFAINLILSIVFVVGEYTEFVFYGGMGIFYGEILLGWEGGGS